MMIFDMKVINSLAEKRCIQLISVPVQKNSDLPESDVDLGILFGSKPAEWRPVILDFTKEFSGFPN